jgi:hypothetical protein
LIAGLPRVQTPAGFDFRLRERIVRLESPQRIRRLEWSVPAWRGLSVGLGIATAVIVGLVFFQPRPTQIPTVASTEVIQQVTEPEANSFPVASPAQEDTQVDRSITGRPERELGDEMLAEQAKPDSSERGFHPSRGYLQSVAGNPSVRDK